MMNQKNELGPSGIAEFNYLGIATDEITDKLIGIVDTYIESGTLEKKVIKKVPLLIAECFQNIIRHTSVISKKTPYFHFTLGEKSIVISSSNTIRSENIDPIKKKIDDINELSEEELKVLRRQLLENTELSEKGGAGLGLIEMAYKTKNKLEYKFIKVQNNTYQFFFKLKLNNQENPTIEKIPISSIIDKYENKSSNKILFDYKGDFNEKSNNFIIEILSGNIVDRYKKEHQTLIFIFIEMLQNISKHGAQVGDTIPGQLTIKKEDHFTIVSENIINPSDQKTFTSHLDTLSKLSAPDLEKFYKEQLFHSLHSTNSNAGIGLVEIVKQSDQLSYQFYTDQNGQTIFKLQIQVS